MIFFFIFPIRIILKRIGMKITPLDTVLPQFFKVLVSRNTNMADVLLYKYIYAHIQLYAITLHWAALNYKHDDDA
jgi:hypothetical protein